MLIVSIIDIGTLNSFHLLHVGEFRRCYNDDEMINVLNWYEIFYAIGINLGPGLPVLFSFVDIQIGWWRIDANNIINVLVFISVTLIFIASWFQVFDLSKELEKIKTDFDCGTYNIPKQNFYTDIQSKSNCKDGGIGSPLISPKEKSTPKRNLMKWKDLLQFEILLLTLSYAFMRVVVSNAVTDVTLIATKTFQWKMNELALLHIILGSSSYLLITLFVKLKVFTGTRTIFYAYISAIITTLIIIAMLVLPRTISLTSVHAQHVLCGTVLFLKCFIKFQAQSAGKYLLFNTVSLDNANFVDGFRSFVGNFFRVLARGTVYYFFMYTEYFAPPVLLVGAIIICILLFRKDSFLLNAKKQSYVILK